MLKKTTARKPATKTVAKKVTAKKVAVAKKPVAKKVTAKKVAVKSTARVATKKAPVKKVATKKVAVAKKPVARKTATRTTARTTRTRPELPTWKAPADFKPFFMELKVRTAKDGLLDAASVQATRYQGSYNPDADPRKKYDMLAYDADTIRAAVARIAMTTYVTNATKRLPANTAFNIVLRVMSRKTKGDIIGVTFKQIAIIKRYKTGRMKEEVLDKKDPMYRKIRKSSRILPQAFAHVQPLPKRTRSRRKVEE